MLIKNKPQVTRTDLQTGKMEVLADNYQGKPFVGPNDVTIDGKGRLYFTDLTGRRRLSDRRPRTARAHPRGAGYSAAERHSDFARRQAAVSDRGERSSRAAPA